MVKFNIPEYFKFGFSVLIKTQQNNINQLIKELKKVPKSLLPSQLADYLFELDLGIWSKTETKQFTDLLFSLYRLKEKERIDIKELANDIYNSILDVDEDELKPPKKFESNLIQLLSINNIDSTIKTVELALEYDKIYSTSRILTDARFSFDTGIGNQIETGVIVHNLKIEYHLNEKDESVFIAMDNSDLKELKEQIIRAEKKEESIKLNLKDKMFFVDYSK